MSLRRMGNLSPEAFADRVGAVFTPEEIAELRATWSQEARLTGPEDWHIFDAPSVTVTVGRPTARALAIFVAANDRQPFNRHVPVDLDAGWRLDSHSTERES